MATLSVLLLFGLFMSTASAVGSDGQEKHGLPNHEPGSDGDEALIIAKVVEGLSNNLGNATEFDLLAMLNGGATNVLSLLGIDKAAIQGLEDVFSSNGVGAGLESRSPLEAVEKIVTTFLGGMGCLNSTPAPSAIRGVLLKSLLRHSYDVIKAGNSTIPDNLPDGVAGLKAMYSFVLEHAKNATESIRLKAEDDLEEPTLGPLIEGRYLDSEEWVLSVLDYHTNSSLIFHDDDCVADALETQSWMVEGLQAGSGKVVLVNLSKGKGVAASEDQFLTLKKGVVGTLELLSHATGLPQIFMRSVYVGQKKSDLSNYYSATVHTAVLPEGFTEYDVMTRAVLGIHPEDYISRVTKEHKIVVFADETSLACQRVVNALESLSPPKGELLVVYFDEDEFLKAMLHSRLPLHRKRGIFKQFLERNVQLDSRGLPLIFVSQQGLLSNELLALIARMKTDAHRKEMNSVENLLRNKKWDSQWVNSVAKGAHLYQRLVKYFEEAHQNEQQQTAFGFASFGHGTV